MRCRKHQQRQNRHQIMDKMVAWVKKARLILFASLIEFITFIVAKLRDKLEAKLPMGDNFRRWSRQGQLSNNSIIKAPGPCVVESTKQFSLVPSDLEKMGSCLRPELLPGPETRSTVERKQKECGFPALSILALLCSSFLFKVNLKEV